MQLLIKHVEFRNGIIFIPFIWIDENGGIKGYISPEKFRKLFKRLI